MAELRQLCCVVMTATRGRETASRWLRETNVAAPAAGHVAIEVDSVRGVHTTKLRRLGDAVMVGAGVQCRITGQRLRQALSVSKGFCEGTTLYNRGSSTVLYDDGLTAEVRAR